MTSKLRKPLRLGFIGGAVNSAVGYAHFTACTLDKKFQLVTGCFSRHKEINQETGIAYGVAPDRVHHNWDSLLEEEAKSIDAILILTPTPTHFPIIKRAIEKNIPIICEKSLTASLNEALEIEAHSKLHAGFLAVTYNYTGYPMLRELRHKIKAGHLGELQQIHVEMPQEGFLRTISGQPPNPQQWRLIDSEIPTVSLDLGIHAHHLVEFLGAGEAVDVISDQRTYGFFKEIVDDISCIARYPNNLRVNYWYGKTAMGYRNGLRIRVFGSKASAEWVQAQSEELIFSTQDGRREIVDRGSPELLTANFPRYTRFKPGHPAGFIEAFANLYTDIADQLATNSLPSENPYVFDASCAVRGLSFLTAVEKSSKSGIWEKVEKS